MALGSPGGKELSEGVGDGGWGTPKRGPSLCRTSPASHRNFARARGGTSSAPPPAPPSSRCCVALPDEGDLPVAPAALGGVPENVGPGTEPRAPVAAGFLLAAAGTTGTGVTDAASAQPARVRVEAAARPCAGQASPWLEHTSFLRRLCRGQEKELAAVGRGSGLGGETPTACAVTVNSKERRPWAQVEDAPGGEAGCVQTAIGAQGPSVPGISLSGELPAWFQAHCLLLSPVFVGVAPGHL